MAKLLGTANYPKKGMARACFPFTFAPIEGKTF